MMNRNNIIIASVLVVAGIAGYLYYKWSLPDFMPVSEDDAERLSNITLE
jgi:hypothetical protein